jgi:anti-anti-sigma factor
MVKTTFELQVTPHALHLTFAGDLLSTNFDAISSEISEILGDPEIQAAEWNLLVLDLRSARLIDSMGLNLMVSLVKQVSPRQAKIKTLISSPTIQRTLVFARLEKYMEIVFEEKSAENP